ncbi:hypothetical protein NL676_009870 [Syzygium grande]|nr:hypothetical protein NL676_009870 [Syzygium grande]
MRNTFVLACILFVSVTSPFLPSTEARRLLLQTPYVEPGGPGWPGPGVGGSPRTPYVPSAPVYQYGPPGVSKRTYPQKVNSTTVP